jgi:hypothetical protein
MTGPEAPFRRQRRAYGAPWVMQASYQEAPVVAMRRGIARVAEVGDIGGRGATCWD